MSSSQAFPKPCKGFLAGARATLTGLWGGFGGHSAKVRSAAFSPDGRRLATGDAQGLIVMWDALRGTALGELKGHRDAVRALAFSPDGAIMLSSAGEDEDGRLIVWDAATGRKRLEAGDDEWPGMVEGLAFRADGRAIVHAWAGEDLVAWLFDPATGTRLEALGTVAHVEPNGRFDAPGGGAYAQIDGAVSVHEPDGRVRWRWRRPVPITAVHVASDGGSALWATRAGELRRVALPAEPAVAATPPAFAEIGTPGGVWGEPAFLQAVAFDAAGHRALAYGRDGRLVEWDLIEGAARSGWAVPAIASGSSIERAGAPAVALAVDRDWRVACVLDAGWRVHAIALESGATRELGQHGFHVWAIAVAPDGARAVSGGGDGARLWDLAAGGFVVPDPAPRAPITAAAFAPDGQRLALAGNAGCAVYEAEAGRLLRELPTPSGPTTAVAFSADGELLACARQDGTIRLWQVATGERLEELSLASAKDQAWALAFSADGRTLLAGGACGVLYRFGL